MSTVGTASPDNLGPRVERIWKYLAEKENWVREVPDRIREAQPGDYEAFLGYRGLDMKKNVSRMHRGFTTEEEDLREEEKRNGDDAFRDDEFALATLHYSRAIRVDHPHNAVCWANKAAALLKLGRWKEAVSSAKAALAEHISIHGYYYGPFHVKVLHRIGIGNIGLGNFELAIRYFHEALKLDKHSVAVKNEIIKAEDEIAAWERHFGDDLKGERRGRKARYGVFWGMSEDDIELLYKAGVMPWDENAKDALMIASGIPLTRQAYSPGENFESEAEGVVVGPAACSYCRGYPRVGGPPVPCVGCLLPLYCSELCMIMDWSVHGDMCMETQQGQITLPGQRNDSTVVQRVQHIMSAELDIIKMTCLYALDIFEDHTAYEEYAAVIDFEYQPDPHLPLRAFDVRKVGMEELEMRYPKILSNLTKNWGQANESDRELGFLGTALAIGLVMDAEWEFAQVQLLTLPKDLFDEPGMIPYDWKNKVLAAINRKT